MVQFIDTPEGGGGEEDPPPHLTPRESLAQAVSVLEAERRVHAASDAQWLAHLYELLQVALQNASVFVASSTTRSQTPEWVRRSLVMELAAAFRLSERKITYMLEDAEALCERFPATLQTLSRGEISYQHAKSLVNEARGLDEDSRVRFEAEALEAAAETTPPQFTKVATTIRERLNPDSAIERKKEALADRHVETWSAPDGMGYLSLYTSIEIVESVDAAARSAAKSLKSAGDERTKTQIAADVLSDALMTGFTEATDEMALTLIPQKTAGTASSSIAAPHAFSSAPDAGPASPEPDADAQKQPAADLAAAGGVSAVGTGVRLGAIRPTVHVTVPVQTLMGISDEPGALEGYGPIDPETARRLAAQAPSFTRILTHPETGTVLSVGRDRYSVPADLRRAVEIRDETCGAVGCNRPAPQCEIDHRNDWQHGGETSYDNLGPLCKKHHMLKHNTTWQIDKTESGKYIWTSPLGRSYVIRPSDRVGFAPVGEAKRSSNRSNATTPPAAAQRDDDQPDLPDEAPF